MMPELIKEKYLEQSPYEADTGHLIGVDPRRLPVADLKLLGHPTSPTKAIRAKCRDCSGGNDAEIRKCVCLNCALWPFRMGVSPFYGKGGASETKPASLEGLE